MGCGVVDPSRADLLEDSQGVNPRLHLPENVVDAVLDAEISRDWSAVDMDEKMDTWQKGRLKEVIQGSKAGEPEGSPRVRRIIAPGCGQCEITRTFICPHCRLASQRTTTFGGPRTSMDARTRSNAFGGVRHVEGTTTGGTRAVLWLKNWVRQRCTKPVTLRGVSVTT